MPLEAMILSSIIKDFLTGFSQDFTLIISGIDSSTFSVNENSLNSLNVWPNPTKDIINFKLPTQTSKPTYVSLYDVQGRQVYKETINSRNAVTRGQIKTSSLARGGLYFKNKSRKCIDAAKSSAQINDALKL
jgi:hypothetical protein